MLQIKDVHKETLSEDQIKIIIEANEAYLDLKKIAELKTLIKVPSQKVGVLRLSYNYEILYTGFVYRYVALFEGYITTWNNSNLLASSVISRTLIESTAAIHFLSEKLSNYMDNNEFEKAHKLVADMALQMKKPEKPERYGLLEIKEVHIMDALRKIQKTYPFILEEYDWLSELAHPNSMGVLGAFTKISEDKNEIQFLKESETKKWMSACLTGAIFIEIFMEEVRKAVEIAKRLKDVFGGEPETF